jgi:uncharacterized membrane protein YeaQ/YmgE (transglycosylase-associated protein family)
MNIILWIIFGAIVGWLASVIMGSGHGIVWDIILGIIGALLGGFIMNALGSPGVTGFNLYSFIVAIVGAMIVICIGRMFRRNTA